MFTPNANSQMLDTPQSSNQGKFFNSKIVKTEQDFDKSRPDIQTFRSQGVPYNMTPHFNLHEPLKTAAHPEKEVDISVQGFVPPNDNSKAEIELDQSFDQGLKQKLIVTETPTDQLQKTALLPDSNIDNQVFIEPPLMIPYLLDFVQEVDFNILANKEGNYLDIYLDFKQQLSVYIHKLDHKFKSARDVYNQLQEFIDLDEHLVSCDREMSTLDELVEHFFQKCSIQDLIDKQWIKYEQQLIDIQRSILDIRHRCITADNICQHQDFQVMVTNDFISNFAQWLHEFTIKYDHFYERMVVYLLNDDLGIEKVFLHLRGVTIEQCEEILFFEELPIHLAFIEQTTLNLRDLIKQLMVLVSQIKERSLKLINKSFDIQKIMKSEFEEVSCLFDQVPIMIQQFKTSLQEQRILLFYVKTPCLNYQKENSELYDKFQAIQTASVEQSKTINMLIDTSTAVFEQCTQQKQKLKEELISLNEEQEEILKLYQILQSLPDLERQVYKIQQQRVQIWDDQLKITSKELQEIQNQNLEALEQKCKGYLSQILSFNNTPPYQIIRLQQWFQAEQQACAVRFNNSFLKAPQIRLDDRINEIMKWEYQSGEESQHENSQIMKSFTGEEKVPQIEEDIQQAFQTLSGQEYDHLLELNNHYNIWKQMQKAALLLDPDNLTNQLKNPTNQFLRDLNIMLISFQLTKSQDYVLYIQDLIQLVNLRGPQQIKQLDQAKYIPRTVKLTLRQSMQQ